MQCRLFTSFRPITERTGFSVWLNIKPDRQPLTYLSRTPSLTDNRQQNRAGCRAYASSCALLVNKQQLIGAGAKDENVKLRNTRNSKCQRRSATAGGGLSSFQFERGFAAGIQTLIPTTAFVHSAALLSHVRRLLVWRFHRRRHDNWDAVQCILGTGLVKQN